MTSGQIPYAALVEGKLMEVVRDVLRETAASGLPDPHHFYITFRTEHPGVEMPSDLRARYRPEMTIVLQHQFWDLIVSEDRFEVTLSFSGRPQRLLIPYVAIKVFADPAVEFGLQFTLAESEPEAEEGADAEGETGAQNDSTLSLPAAETQTLEPRAEGAGDDDEDAGDKSESQGSADVVSLDRFRKR